MKSLSVKLGVILVVGLTIFGYGCPVVNIANEQCARVLWEQRAYYKVIKDFTEFLMSQVVQQEALTRLLVEKGMFTKAEFL